MSWFPRPLALDDIDAAGSNKYDAPTLWSLLTRASADEWRDRVGVAGTLNGSAKSSLRLLCSDGRVLKTCLTSRRERRDFALTDVLAARTKARATPLWHPGKDWFALSHREGWLAVSVCPRLKTLRELETPRARLDAWIRTACFALASAQRYGIGLDLNPANFGYDVSGALHYIDDECYPEPTNFLDIGDFIAARLLEDDTLQGRARGFGTDLAFALKRYGASERDLSVVAEAVASYPVPQRRSDTRQTLLAGLRAARVRQPRASKRRSTCILADVHANLPALDAVLSAVKDVGVDDYLVLGDVVGYGPNPTECIERLAELPTARVLRGNHDDAINNEQVAGHLNSHARWVIDWTSSRLADAHRQWLEGLPIELRDEEFLAVHGAPRDPHKLWAYVYQLTFRDNLDHLAEQGIPLCFYGHTHVPFVYEAQPSEYRQLGHRPLDLRGSAAARLVNPGSVGQPRDGDSRASFALWDRTEDRIRFHRVPYDVDRTTRVMERHGFPDDLLHRLALGR